ncbi:putative RNA-directed DNA polymerase, eukaryota, reverse transcriptase zinc-binding domain protein [Tanacetum coccineum]
MRTWNRRGSGIPKGGWSKYRVTKCSTSFGKFNHLDRKGFSFIDEMNKMIEVGDALGYDVKGCKRSLRKLINGNIIHFGDLNEVRFEAERFGSSFSRSDAEIFNAFIHDTSLIDLRMGGRSVLLEHSNLQVTVLEKVWSDHNPILLHCTKADFGSIPFKVFNSWFDRTDFDDVVKEAWSGLSNVDGEIGVRFLEDVNEKFDAGLASEEEKLLRINTWFELDNLEKLESKDLFQKARVKWDVEGDENSKFFHGIINSKRNTQRIHGIMHEGVWITDPNEIKSAFLNFFKEKFSCHDSLVSFPTMTAVKRLTDKEVAYLDSMVSLEEIKKAVWDWGSQKAPGSDGFSFMFIKKFWDLLHLDIQNFVVSFFSKGSFPPGVNSSFFTLIPKVSNPLYIKDYRPISLIGFQYKIVAKILANRLSKVIDSIVSPEQSAFIVGRQILDGPLILSKVIDWYKKRKKKMLLFKVDFEKAFDSVSWRYLDHVMDNLGFSSKWRRWIKSGLMSYRASILVNGSPTSEFSLKRGLRKGDPLLPFFFIIIMEGLNIALKDGLSSNMFLGVKVGSPGICLSHLFYADDVIIFSEWNQQHMDNIIRILNIFYLPLGLRTNINKSNLYGIGVSNSEVESMAAGSGCSPSYLPFSYLGLPIVLKVLESLRASFFWGASAEKRKLAWVKWSPILAPLEKGGLGVGSLKAFNLSLLLKWRWRLMNDPSAL